MARLLMAMVVLALLVGACAFYPVGEGRDVRRDDPRPVVVAVDDGGAGSVTVVPPEPRPTPEYRGTPVIICITKLCKQTR